MMRYWASPFQGSGTRTAPYQVIGMGPGVSMLDLRPNAATGTGYAICAGPTLPVSGSIDDLGDTLDTPSAAIKTALNSRLGITLSASTLRGILVELFEVWAGGSRWKRLTRGNRTMGQIYLGNEWIGEVAPPIAGGSPAISKTESFNAADSANLTADLVWTEVSGTAWGIVTNRARYTGSGVNGAGHAVAQEPVATMAHIVQATLNNWSLSGTYISGIITARESFNAAAGNWYELECNVNEGAYKLAKTVATSRSVVATLTGTVTAGHTVAIKCNGSTISCSINGGAYQDNTDTAIAYGSYGGLYAFHNANGDWVEFDTWSITTLQTTFNPPLMFRGMV